MKYLVNLRSTFSSTYYGDFRDYLIEQWSKNYPSAYIRGDKIQFMENNFIVENKAVYPENCVIFNNFVHSADYLEVIKDLGYEVDVYPSSVSLVDNKYALMKHLGYYFIVPRLLINSFSKGDYVLGYHSSGLTLKAKEDIENSGENLIGDLNWNEDVLPLIDVYTFLGYAVNYCYLFLQGNGSLVVSSTRTNIKRLDRLSRYRGSGYDLSDPNKKDKDLVKLFFQEIDIDTDEIEDTAEEVSSLLLLGSGEVLIAPFEENIVVDVVYTHFPLFRFFLKEKAYKQFMYFFTRRILEENSSPWLARRRLFQIEE